MTLLKYYYRIVLLVLRKNNFHFEPSMSLQILPSYASRHIFESFWGIRGPLWATFWLVQWSVGPSVCPSQSCFRGVLYRVSFWAKCLSVCLISVASADTRDLDLMTLFIHRWQIECMVSWLSNSKNITFQAPWVAALASGHCLLRCVHAVLLIGVHAGLLKHQIRHVHTDFLWHDLRHVHAGSVTWT